ncbi:hypothetical protein [Paludisphaera soli]|uniref:hypothetical protein n=1 Tax=Paludisphaera soli TaxID=2712865 RepID=UPI0019802DDB|nr:hypothetical protein [Paludisphaera soli]
MTTTIPMEAAMLTIGEMTLEVAATQAAGNWRRFSCFCWGRNHDLDDPGDWAIIYTHNRDSGLLDLSNAQAVAKAIWPFTEDDDPDVVMESHGHWAVGHVDGFSIRVYRDGEITDAFRTYHDLVERLAEYPILDEEDYGRREYEATLENIADSAWRLKGGYDLPEGWEGDVHSWLSEHRQRAVENLADQGGYPEEDDLHNAFEALDCERLED